MMASPGFHVAVGFPHGSLTDSIANPERAMDQPEVADLSNALCETVANSPPWFCWGFCQMLSGHLKSFKELGKDEDGCEISKE